MARRLLIVDDEQAALRYLGRFFQAKGFDVAQADDGRSGLARFADFSPEIVLLDLRLPDADGMDLLAQFKKADASVGVVIITAHGDVDTAVTAMRAHADHFLLKPVDLDALHGIVQRLVNQRSQREELEYLRGQVQSMRGHQGEALLPEELAEHVRLLAASEATAVLITGETGTGKGVLARLIHDNSSRRDKSFIDINCAGLDGPLLESELFGHERGSFTGAKERKRGLIETAAGGTLFLDEIGDMPLDVQAKLLKVIEDRSFRRVGGVQTLHVDLRLMAATNVDLQAAAKAGKFREDLYYRLSVVPIELPPLRARPASVSALAEKFLEEFRAKMNKPQLRMTSETLELLMSYSWPGNIRELRNIIERAVLLCNGSELGTCHLPEALRPKRGRQSVDPAADNTLATVEANHIRLVLESVKGNRSQAADLLGVHRSTLIAKIKKYSIES